MVHAYKKNGWLYRTWEFPLIVENNDNFLCLYINKAWVTTSEKDSNRNFHSTNLNNSLWFFFKDKWFNIIATVGKNKVNYYVNLASPYIFEEDAIKYIDFDYDIKINQNGTFTILDADEFELHKEKFNYGWKLSRIIEIELAKLNSKEEIDHIREELTLEVLNKLLAKAKQFRTKTIKIGGIKDEPRIRKVLS